MRACGKEITVARLTTKQRKKQLKQDAFRDTTMDFYDRLAHRAEGRGRTILYVVSAIVAAGHSGVCRSALCDSSSRTAARVDGRTLASAIRAISSWPKSQ